LGVSLAELFAPVGGAWDSLGLLRQQARDRMEQAIGKAERHELEMMLVLGASLSSAFSRNR